MIPRVSGTFTSKNYQTSRRKKRKTAVAAVLVPSTELESRRLAQAPLQFTNASHDVGGVSRAIARALFVTTPGSPQLPRHYDLLSSPLSRVPLLSRPLPHRFAPTPRPYRSKPKRHRL